MEDKSQTKACSSGPNEGDVLRLGDKNETEYIEQALPV